MENMRNISTEGLPLLGTGRTASVYALSDKEVLKVYLPTYPDEKILSDWEITHKVQEAGIPCAGALERVQAGDLRGMIFERVSSKTLGDIIFEALRTHDRETLNKWTDYYIAQAKQLHAMTFPSGTFPDIKEQYLNKLKKAEGVLISEESSALLAAALRELPDSNHFLHGDLNPTNMLLPEENGLLIDVGDAAQGDPLFDFCYLLSIKYFFNRILPDLTMRTFAVPGEEADHFCEMVLRKYYADADEVQFHDIERRAGILGVLYGVTMDMGSGDHIPMLYQVINQFISEEM